MRVFSWLAIGLLGFALVGCIPAPPDPLGKKLWQAMGGGGGGGGGGHSHGGSHSHGYGHSHSPSPSGRSWSTGSQCSGVQADAVLAEHNRARAEVGVAPLQWSNRLAGVAQQWADHLARTGKFEHSRNRGYGENLAWSSVKGMEPVQGVRMWYEEKRDYRGEAIGQGRSGAVTGHYTQMVWRGTTEVGCGVATGANGTVVVCTYNPPGNMVGQRPY